MAKREAEPQWAVAAQETCKKELTEVEGMKKMNIFLPEMQSRVAKVEHPLRQSDSTWDDDQVLPPSTQSAVRANTIERVDQAKVEHRTQPHGTTPLTPCKEEPRAPPAKYNPASVPAGPGHAVEQEVSEQSPNNPQRGADCKRPAAQEASAQSPLPRASGRSCSRSTFVRRWRTLATKRLKVAALRSIKKSATEKFSPGSNPSSPSADLANGDSER